jgi:hypothetical protein
MRTYDLILKTFEDMKIYRTHCKWNFEEYINVFASPRLQVTKKTLHRVNDGCRSIRLHKVNA